MKQTLEHSATISTDQTDIEQAISKYGVHESENPPYVLVGLIKLPNSGWNGGILAFAMTEWNAYQLKRVLAKYAMDKDDITICRTESHPEGETYSVDCGVAIERTIRK